MNPGSLDAVPDVLKQWLERFLDWEETNEGRTSGRHRLMASCRATALLMDVLMRLLERRGLLAVEKNRCEILGLHQRVCLWRHAEAVRSAAARENFRSPMDGETAQAAALWAAELLGLLDRSTALVQGAGNELDFLWFRHAAGNVMGDCCDVLNEIQSGHPELTWEKIQQLLAERGSGEGETKA